MNKFGKIISLFFLYVFVSTLAYAADISFSAYVNRKEVAVNKKIVLSLTVEGVKDPSLPKLPQLDGFDVFSSGSSSKVNIINGKYSASRTFNYVLVPRKEGELIIGAVTLEHEGETYKTKPITITVLKADTSSATSSSTTSSPGDEQSVNLKDNLFLELSTDKREIYLNEQLKLTFRLYRRRVNIDQIQYVPPGTKDFIEESLGEQKNYQKQINGLLYEIIEINTALFPVRTGELVIDPAKIKCNLLIKQGRNQNRSSAFDNFFSDPFFDDPFFSSYVRKPIELKSNELTIMVKPQPETDKPDSFSGAVGQFDMNVDVSPKQLNKGEPITLKVTISGDGNIKAVTFPKIASLADFKTYEPETKVKTQIRNGNVYGEKVFEKVLVPKKAGALTIPEITFAYFDPKLAKYQIKKFQETTIQVADLPPEERVSLPTEPTSSSPAVFADKKAIELYSRDILFIKEDMGDLQKVGDGMLQPSVFITINTIPLFFLIVLYLFKRRQQRLRDDIGYARFKVANKMFNKKLQEAKKALKKKDRELFYAVLYKAMQEYLGNKFNIPAAGITLNIVDERLKALDIGEKILTDVEQLFNVCDMAKFGVGTFSDDQMKETLLTVERVFAALDRKL